MSMPLAGLVGTDALLDAVLQTVAQPICVVDPQGLIRFANPAAAAALGYEDPDALVGLPGSALPAAAFAAPIGFPGGDGAVQTWESTRGQAVLSRLAERVRRGEPARQILEA